MPRCWKRCCCARSRMAVYAHREQGPLRPGAGGLRPLHLADPPLSRPAAASRAQARADRAAAPVASAIRRSKWPRLCTQCSEKERRADEAEREVDERYRSAWMEQHVGSEFDGVISGVTSFGLFVELDLIQGQRPGARDPVAARLLPFRSGAQDRSSGERKGMALPPGRSDAGAGAARQRRGPRIDFKLVLPRAKSRDRK